MEDENLWQWIVGILATAWMGLNTVVSQRLYRRIERVEETKADGNEICRRLDELNKKVDRHDGRNSEQHDKVFDALTDTKVDLARIEQKVDSLGSGQ